MLFLTGLRNKKIGDPLEFWLRYRLDLYDDLKRTFILTLSSWLAMHNCYTTNLGKPCTGLKILSAMCRL